MLTLSQSRQCGLFQVYRDFTIAEGKVQYTNAFYVLPSAPRFSIVDGDPAFDFVRYRSAAGTGAQAGGILTMTVELSPTAEERDALGQSIATGFGVPSTDVETRSVPFKSGTVQLVYAGDTAGGEFVNQLSGNGPALLASAERASFIVDLTKDGAALLKQALDRKADLFHLRYDLVFDHRLTGVHLRVWCDTQRALAAAGQWFQAGATNPNELRASLSEQKLAGVDLVAEEPLPLDQVTALQKAGNDLLAIALTSALFQPGDGGTPKPRPYSEQMEAKLNFSLDESYPLEQHAILDAILHLELTAEQMSRRVREIDLSNSFFTVLEVQIVCTADFSLGLITAVTVRVDYDATANGGRIQRSGEFLFKEGTASVQHFRTDIAAADKKSFRYSVDVWYRGDPNPLHLDYPDVERTTIILDLDATGILEVAMELRDVPFDTVAAAVVDLEYPSQGLTQRMILDGKNMRGVWRAVIRESRQALRYKIDWLLMDGRRLSTDWTVTAATLVYLDAPAVLQAKMRIQVIAAGDFSELSSAEVDLRSRVDSQVQAQLSFTGSGEGHLWEAPSTTGRPDYEYRRTFIYKDGHVRVADADWVAETRPVLVVADGSRFQVQLIPKFLDLGGSLKLAIAELESQAASSDTQERKTIVLKSKTDQATFSFGMQNGNRHAYRYRLTAIASQGERQPPTEWQESDSEILVLQLPNN
jgi:hypothetical protein